MSATRRTCQQTVTALRQLAPLLLLWALVSVHDASAAQDYWSVGGPEGGEVRAVAVDPTDPMTLYAGVNGGGVFKSTDGAAHWSPTGGSLGSGVVFTIIIDPKTPTTIYARSDGHEDGRGIFKSTDSGRSWSGLRIGRGNVAALVLDPVTPTTIYVGSEAQSVVKSTDGGTTWQTKDTGLTSPYSPYIRSLAIVPADGETLYAGTLDGVFKSTDGAATWHAANNGLAAETVVLATAIDPAARDTVYIGTPHGIFKSTDAGGHWDPSNVGLTETNVVGLTLDAGVPGTLYATTSTACGDCEGEVFRSTDGGAHWEPTTVGPLATLVHSLVVTGPRTLFAGTFAAGVLTSTDGGSSWGPVNNGLISANVRALAAAATAPNTTIYASVFGGIFKSTNGGLWADANTGLTDINISALAAAPSSPTTLYAGGFATTNGGDSWSETGGVVEPTVFAVDPQIATTTYAGSSRDGLYKTTDGGATWSHVDVAHVRDSGVSALAIDPRTPATLYAGVVDDDYPGFVSPIYKSTDAGVSWTAASVGLDLGISVTALAIDPLTPSTIYAAADYGGVFKSTGGAASWGALNNGLPTITFVSSLAIDPLMPSTLYAGTTSGVFKSTSGGTAWRPLNTGLRAQDVSSLVLDPQGPSVLYAGTYAHGVWTIAQSDTCPGDCDHSGQVTVIELITGLNIALDVFPVTRCASLDQSGDGSVSIEELVAAVHNALNSCPASN